jgi:hypothetical protein
VELLELMGAETANVHLATRAARRAILSDLEQRGRSWLRRAARRMARRVEQQHAEWSSEPGHGARSS